MSAQAEGVSLEAYLSRVSERGFGIPLVELVTVVFEDALANCGDRWSTNHDAV